MPLLARDASHNTLLGVLTCQAPQLQGYAVTDSSKQV